MGLLLDEVAVTVPVVADLDRVILRRAVDSFLSNVVIAVAAGGWCDVDRAAAAPGRGIGGSSSRVELVGDGSNGWDWVGTSVKRRELIDWSMFAAEPVVEFAFLEKAELSEVVRVRPWPDLKEEEIGEVGVDELGEVLVLCVLCSLDRIWFWV